MSSYSHFPVLLIFSKPSHLLTQDASSMYECAMYGNLRPYVCSFSLENTPPPPPCFSFYDGIALQFDELPLHRLSYRDSPLSCKSPVSRPPAPYCRLMSKMTYWLSNGLHRHHPHATSVAIPISPTIPKAAWLQIYSCQSGDPFPHKPSVNEILAEVVVSFSSTQGVCKGGGHVRSCVRLSWSSTANI